MPTLRSVSPEFPQNSANGDDFRTAMSQLAAGVCVITVGRGEERTGLTLTSILTLSIDPPRLLLCIDKTAEAWPILNREGCFGVNLLCARHELVGDRFVDRGGIRGAERYAEAKWLRLHTGVRLLADALAAIDCEIEETIDRRFHSIVIGRVRAVVAPERTSSLVRWRGRYEQLGWSDLQASLAVGL